MEFKSLIVSPILRPHQYFTRREITCLKEHVQNKFLQYGTASCTYYCRHSESSFHEYTGNYVIVDFQRHEDAKKALTAAGNSDIYIKGMLITAKPIELFDSPIQNLPTECLLEIFKRLSKYEQLKLQRVCTRWQKVAPMLWTSIKKIDLISEDATLTDDNHIITSGIYLKDIRYYGDRHFKLVHKHCPNVESMAIEFRKYSKVVNWYNPDCIKFEPKLLTRFRWLTRLMLKIRNDQYLYFDFLQQLPKTMVEIHLLNDISLGHFTHYNRARPEIPYDFSNCSRKVINLSRFSNLHALTLKAYKFDDYALIGFENLMQLRSICLDDCFLSQTNIQRLNRFTDLEHLSLRNVEMRYVDARELLARNNTLNYLALPMLLDYRANRHESLWTLALRLPNLKTLCWANMESGRWQDGSSRSIENLELNSVSIPSTTILSIFEHFPNLKIIKKTVWRDDCPELFIGRLKYATARRSRGRCKFISGQLLKSIDPSSSDYTRGKLRHVQQPTPEDARLLRCDDWNGWYVDDESLKS